MNPENQQTVYTVLDVLAALLPFTLVCYAIAGVFTGSARAVGNRPWCLIYAASCIWLAARGLGLIA